MKLKEYPKLLRPYIWHGVDLDYVAGEKNIYGECPFCGGAKKFSVNAETGQWRCLKCNEGSEGNGNGHGKSGFKGGNVYTFLRLFWQRCYDQTGDYTILSKNRGIPEDVLRTWGVCRSYLTKEWLIPGYGVDRKLNNLYRYVKVRTEDGVSHVCMCTPTLNHQMHGGVNFDPDKEDIYLLEGPWDGMACWAAMHHVAHDKGLGFRTTTKVKESIANSANVLAVPGSGVFPEVWLPMFAGKRVYLLYDNDHPKLNKQTGKMMPPNGWESMRRVAEILAKSEQPPSEIHVLKWGDGDDEFQGYDPNLNDGYDVRDHLRTKDKEQRANNFINLMGLMVPMPEEWLEGRSKDAVAAGSTEIQLLPCHSYRRLVKQFKRALEWSPGMDHALAACLASIASVERKGDQLWLKIMGPASSGKTTIAEALSVCRKYVFPKSTIRGFHSGSKGDKEGKGGEDNSLLVQLYNKTLVTKDGDTLLKAPELTRILAEARDIYDGSGRTHYRHGHAKDYENVRMTWLLFGTASLREIDSSELGERFLDVVIMETIDDILEDKVSWRKAQQARDQYRESTVDKEGKVGSQHPKEYLKAMQMTGGYITYIRENANELSKGVVMSDDQLRQCCRLAKFIAHLRARPGSKQKESAERELSPRLTSQMTRLALSLAVVMNKSSVDSRVMRRVTKIALDTSRGQTMEICKRLLEVGRKGLTHQAIALKLNETDSNMVTFLKFLAKIKVVERYFPGEDGRKALRPKWRLTVKMTKLWESIIETAIEGVTNAV